jgi:hypothetical protein
MRSRILRAVLFLCALSALAPAAAPAQPVNGPRETVDQRFTATRSGSPTGVSYAASYHAAGNRKGNPPYLIRIVFYPPRGFRYDTSVPDRCTAPDAVLEALGPDACPAGSRLGRGKVEGIFYEPIGHDFVVDHYKHDVDVMNNANEQIVLVKSEGYTVVRGRVRPDSSIEFTPTTCFPSPPTGQCLDDYIRQLKSSSTLPLYKRTTNGFVRSYATTPPKCPAAGYWRSTIRIWWRNGAVDSVLTKQPCRPLRGSRGH